MVTSNFSRTLPIITSGGCIYNIQAIAMGISDKSKLPNFKANLEVDVRSLFGLPPEKVVPQPKAQPSVAELAQEKVQAEFAKLATLHGPALEQARRNFIESLQVYNAAVGAHQGSKIAGLDSPFISTPELIRQSSVIQTSMQRDMILNAREQAQKMVSDAQELWGTSTQNDRELSDHFEEVAQKLSGALAQFDAGNVDGAFAIYRRVVSENDAHMGWMARDMRHSEQLKKGAEFGLTAAAGCAAMVMTDGVALAFLGSDGVAALSGGARLGLLAANGAAFSTTHRALEQQILHIPFWRKDGVAANAIDLGIDIGRTAALMGTLKVVGEGASALLPIAKTEPALAALRNFGAEISGFNSFDIAMGSDPREIFTLHHQLDQVSFLLGLRAANGVISGIPSMMKGATALYDRIIESPTLTRLAYASLGMLGLFAIPSGGFPLDRKSSGKVLSLTGENLGQIAQEDRQTIDSLTNAISNQNVESLRESFKTDAPIDRTASNALIWTFASLKSEIGNATWVIDAAEHYPFSGPKFQGIISALRRVPAEYLPKIQLASFLKDELASPDRGLVEASDAGRVSAWGNSLPRAEVNALRLVGGPEFSGIYGYLRGVDAKQLMMITNAARDGAYDIRSWIFHIDAAMERLALAQELVVYKGRPLKNAMLDWEQLAEGKTFSDAAYFSTTTRKVFAENWFGPSSRAGGEPHEHLLMTIHLPVGARYAYIDHPKISPQNRADEILLPRGSRFLIKRKYQDLEGRRHLEVELVL